ncbi:hypothetical protein V6N13_028557 [Hibiscus sabdariffa]
MLGDMVWEHNMQKAEVAEDGAKFCFLRENFTAGDASIDAKETCYNWFYKRLVMMTRGLADPLAFAYCLLYIFDRDHNFSLCATGYLITCVNDIKLIFTQISSTEETVYGSFVDSIRSLVNRAASSVEFIMKSILNDAIPRRVDKVLVELGLGRNQQELFTFADGTFGVLGHGNKECVPYSREVESSGKLVTLGMVAKIVLDMEITVICLKKWVFGANVSSATNKEYSSLIVSISVQAYHVVHDLEHDFHWSDEAANASITQTVQGQDKKEPNGKLGASLLLAKNQKCELNMEKKCLEVVKKAMRTTMHAFYEFCNIKLHSIGVKHLAGIFTTSDWPSIIEVAP